MTLSIFRPTLILATALAAGPLAAQTTAGPASARRPVRAADVYRIREVRDPQRSPDGRWVAYVVAGVDTVKDRSTSDLWMTSWRGDTTVRLTSTPESESSPRWSPDGRWLSFLSSRGDAKGTQLWLLDRTGGEAQRVSNVKGGISDYAWSPDGSRIVLVVGDSASADDSTSKPKPIVVDRYHFKSDGPGYLGAEREHLALFDVATRRSVPLTPGPYEEQSPSWSPDGRSIAFISNRATDPDRSENTDLFVMEARAGATPRRLTTFEGPDEGPPAWSPDGKLIAYKQGSDPKYTAYNLYNLAVIPAAGGTPRLVAATLDRSIGEPRWSADGAALYVIVTDDRARHVARFPLATSAPAARVVAGERVVTGLSVGRDGGLAVVATTSDRPHELFAVEGGALRRLTHHNDEWLSEVRLATTEGISAKSADGTTVNGLLVKPLDYVAGRRYPTLLRIHGGPNLQDQYEFHLERELFAANGYAVVTANYRGSAGRGAAYGQSIFADWGNREVQDLLAMTDRAVAIGVADPERLGIGGWSYGAILTNYVIASDKRFKAATSGAGSSLQIAMYGTDEYVIQYEAELGPPWKNQDAWIKVSYPFFHADRISTPTLFLGGDQDFNVPLLGSEQMYQALRSLGIETQLIVYPGQHHGIARPSFKKDRLERYVGWYDRFLKGTRTAASP